MSVITSLLGQLIHDPRRRADSLRGVHRRTLTVRHIDHLMAAMGWAEQAILDRSAFDQYRFAEDLNQRRLRDAEVLLTAARNAEPEDDRPQACILEIGTADGSTTARLSRNNPDARIHTVNIPPEDIQAGRGGTHVTYAPDTSEIGRAYREAGCNNVTQVLADTADWEPSAAIDPIDLAFIDGCHDAEYVVNDTMLVLGRSRPGTVILWHDFNPDLADKFAWIGTVCQGVEQLISRGMIHGRVLHLQDSWVGAYQVCPKDLEGARP